MVVGCLWCLLLFVWFVLCLGVYVLLVFGYALFGVYGFLVRVWCELGVLLVCFWVLLVSAWF